MRTELRIEGANCPHCLNETVDRLRALDGVTVVNSSLTDECLVVEHDELDPETFVRLLADSVHGVAMAANEVVMEAVVPTITVVHCQHSARGSRRSTTGEPATATSEDAATIDPAVTLGVLVTERPGLAPSLDRLGLDYCCGGHRTLAEAVGAAALDLDGVIEVLDSEPRDPGPAEWARLGIAELVDHLEKTHHAYLDDALPRLSTLAAKVHDVHGDRHPELADVLRLVHELRDHIEPHLRSEEQVLFPMIRELAAEAVHPTVRRRLDMPISVMLHEHDDVGELLAALRAATRDFEVPADGCASLRSLYAGLAALETDTHLHVHKENNLLVPGVLDAERALAHGAG